MNDDINSSVGEGDEVRESGGTSGLGELQQLGFSVSGSISKSVDEVYEAVAGAWRTAAGGLLQVGESVGGPPLSLTVLLVGGDRIERRVLRRARVT
ncbi:hypothetical protein [Pseudoclavibacter sp. VKM Ac-2867]|uniref:hypothetical protein n=1 Tax=Pseudoclavibacter sp. VKM Ac-2867 TaxID=2783829 RepID=UPI00188CDA92|nr:hypothetical protein [Pseudoclavibacter sp. VKM Ac-2867]MBF4459101.1 hypothetical protein [Pseudoclavibacter sp. VKM Ac-2867]